MRRSARSTGRRLRAPRPGSHELSIEFDQMIMAELTSERYAELRLKAGDVVYVSARRSQVFSPSYSI